MNKPTKLPKREAPGVMPLKWEGDSKKTFDAFPEDAKQKAGYQLDRVQHGRKASNEDGRPDIGPGTRDVKVTDDGKWFRVFVVAKFGNTVHVLHTFQKKSNTTPKQDIETAKQRYAALVKQHAGAAKAAKKRRRSDEPYDEG